MHNVITIGIINTNKGITFEINKKYKRFHNLTLWDRTAGERSEGSFSSEMSLL